MLIIPDLKRVDGTNFKLDHPIFIMDTDREKTIMQAQWTEHGKPYLLLKESEDYCDIKIYYDHGYGHLFMIENNVVLSHSPLGDMVYTTCKKDGVKIMFLGMPYQPYDGLYVKIGEKQKSWLT